MEAKRNEIVVSKLYSELDNLDISMLGGPMLAEIGKIKIGGKGKETRSVKGKVFRLPEKYDHFIVTTNFKDPHSDNYIPDRRLMEMIADQTGQNPDSLKFIPVTLLFDDPDLNFIVRFSCYRGTHAWCIGDGKKAYRLNEQGGRVQVPCPCERVLPEYDGPERCKVFGRLSVIIRGVERLGGVWVFRTTSWNSVRSIMSSMMFFRQLTGGILAGIPFILSLHPKTVVVPTTGQIQTIYVVALEFQGTQQELFEHALKIRKTRLEYKIQTEALEEQIRKSLPVAFEEDEKDIAEEFFPENIEGDEERQNEEKDKQTEDEPDSNQEGQDQPESSPSSDVEDEDIETLW